MVTRGIVKSCGCYNRKISTERIVEINTKHGYSPAGKKNKTYLCWSNMKSRCMNKNHEHYIHYGGRGIKVCDRWMRFENFLEDMGEAPRNVSLDKIDNNKDYCKENCRWINTSRQARNRRSNKIIEYNNEKKCLAEWCELYNRDYTIVWQRITKGKWDFNRAILTLTKRGFNGKRK